MDPFVGKRLKDVQRGDLSRLVEDSIPESLWLDYKESLSLDSKDDKKEFLRDVTAFANAQGGLLLYGISEERDSTGKSTGVPAKITGIEIPNKDKKLLSVQNLLRDGIDERLPTYEIETVSLEDGRHVLALRIRPSFRAPHMVILGRERRFYLRINGANQDMSTAQIRDSVMKTDSFEEGVRKFVNKRLARIRKIANGQPFWVLHLIPILRNQGQIDVTKREVVNRLCKLRSPLGGNEIHCLEGLKLTSKDPDGNISHTMVFRNGTIEFLDQQTFAYGKAKRLVPYETFHQTVFQCLCAGLQLYREGYLDPPFAISLALGHISGYSLPSFSIRFSPVPVEEDTIQTEPVLQYDIPEDQPGILKPLLDVVWNAFGFIRCRSYDENGNFTRW